ncbi:hypothetical protein AYI68_g259 [Smittium mucronatum]|uniref:Uncharacterized protein n=1 Tax=Smittium mucronatum TaxID=133383 RepID=A0A1R0H8W5_9FUNG|nr:hypothetical protein AYI68_g259 [Smittium mucronatum]
MRVSIYKSVFLFAFVFITSTSTATEAGHKDDSILPQSQPLSHHKATTGSIQFPDHEDDRWTNIYSQQKQSVTHEGSSHFEVDSNQNQGTISENRVDGFTRSNSIKVQNEFFKFFIKKYLNLIKLYEEMKNLASGKFHINYDTFANDDDSRELLSSKAEKCLDLEIEMINEIKNQNYDYLNSDHIDYIHLDLYRLAILSGILVNKSNGELYKGRIDHVKIYNALFNGIYSEDVIKNIASKYNVIV